MHNIIKLHSAVYRGSPAIYVFIDKIAAFIEVDGHTNITLVGPNPIKIKVKEPVKEILELIASADAVEADESRAVFKDLKY